MADTKISALSPVPSIVGTEVIPVAKSGTTQGATVNQIKTYLGVSGVNTGDQDLSGLVPKTTTVNSHPLSGNVVVTASDVGLGNVDNTSDANKPVSTATATALSGKQATLVSGTNIKTINGSSVLGSGDLTITGAGTVTTVGVVTANGLAGSVANPTTTPSITLSTNVVGIAKGNGTGFSAATAGTDFLVPPSGTAILKANSGGALANAVSGTDYQAPIGTISGVAKGNGANALTAATAGIDFVAPGTATSFTKQQYFGEVTLTYAATQTWDVSVAQVAKVTLTGNVSFSAPTNQVAGAYYGLRIIQDATGSRTASGWTNFKFANGSAPALSTAANSNDFFVFRSDGTYMYEQGRSQGVA